MLADRSPTKTVAKLRDEFDIELSADVVRKWSQRHEWAKKAVDLFHETAPTYFERVRSGLVGSGSAAYRYLYDVLEGRAEPDRVKAMVAFGVLDRIGFLPYTRREAESGHTPIARTTTGDDWADLSESELQAIVRGRVLELSPSSPQ